MSHLIKLLYQFIDNPHSFITYLGDRQIASLFDIDAIPTFTLNHKGRP